VGVAFSILANTQNIGYIIPCEEIELFLQDVHDGRYYGKPAIYDEFQTLENPALRLFLKLDKSVEGIVVHEPYRLDPGYPLKQWDVITKIGSVQINNQGFITLADNLKVSFSYMVQKLAQDGQVALTIVREGKELSLSLPVSSSRPKLIPFLQGTYPSYFICGPLVFSVASEEFIAALTSGDNTALAANLLSASANPLYSRRGDRPAFEGEGLVVVPSPMFAHPLGRNYSSPVLRVLQSMNGIRVKNLRHLVEIIRDSKDDFLVFEFAGRGGETLVFPRKEIVASTDTILNDSGIRAQGSSDLLAVWNQKAQ
jgi:hypothetical protein